MPTLPSSPRDARPLRLAAALALPLLGACATSSRVVEPGRLAPWAMPDLPHSSLAAVVSKRDALGLDDAQVQALLERDAALVHEQHALLGRAGGGRPPRGHGGGQGAGGSAAGIAESSGGPGGGGMGGGGPGGGGPGGMGPPGGMGGGMGGMGGPPGGGMGDMGGGGPLGGQGGPPGGGARGELTAEEATRILDALDAADTRAFLRAEEAVLRPEQREAAREAAGDYRAALKDRRDDILAGKVPAPPLMPAGPGDEPPGPPPDGDHRGPPPGRGAPPPDA
ncbi:MAG: hypothetical protein QM767_23560 [Anaeromyxobacter sp.]